MKRRRMVKGYVDYGALQVPPLPTGILLEDRADGTIWLVSWNTTESSVDGEGYISINTVYPGHLPYYRYGPYSGPYVNGQHGIGRLCVRGGRLGVEIIGDRGYVVDAKNQPVYATKGNNRRVCLINTYSGWDQYDPQWAWTPEDLG